MSGYGASFGAYTPPPQPKDNKKSWGDTLSPIMAVLNAIRGPQPGPSGINFGMDSPTSGDPTAMLRMMQENPVGSSPLADRSAADARAPQDPAQAAMTPIEALMAQIMGGGGKAAIRAAIAPQRAAVNALQDQLGQVGLQTDQNVADINSWFGQVAQDTRHDAKTNLRAAKKARKGEKRLGAGLLQGIADPNVARAVAGTTGRHTGSLMRQGLEQAHFDRAHASDIAQQGAYQALVQERLGAQAEAGIRSQLAQAQAAKVAAKASAKGGDIGQLLQLLGLFGDSPIVDKYLMGGGFDPSLIEGPAGADAMTSPEKGSALQSALGSVDFFQPDTQGGMPTGGLQDLLKSAYGAAAARLGPEAIQDPEVQQMIRAYIQSHVAQTYNNKLGTNWHLNDQGSFFTQK